MSPPSSGDERTSDDAAPTRRAVLTTLAAGAGLASAGCLDLGSGDPAPASEATESGTANSTQTAGSRPSTTTVDPTDAVTLSLTNAAPTDRKVRVRVRSSGDGGNELDESLTVSPESVDRLGAFSPTDSYHVVVEDLSADRRRENEWTVRGALRDLRIVVGEETIGFEQSATCTPDCDPVSVGGEAVDLPHRRTGADPTRSPAAVRVTSAYEPTGETEPTLSLVVRDGDATVLDYEYRLAAAWRLRLPAVLATKGWYTVEASVGDETTTYDWRVAGPHPELTVRVDDRGVPRIGCGTDPQPLLLVNRRAEGVTVDLRLAKRGATVWDGPVGLGAGSELRLTPIEMGDDLTVEARVGDAVAAGEYVTCRCRGGATTVTVDEALTVRSDVTRCG